MSVVPIAADRIEIGEVVGLGLDCWMMFVVEGGDKEGDSYAERYPTREAAIEAARTWDMPIRFINEPGTFKLSTPWIDAWNDDVGEPA